MAAIALLSGSKAATANDVSAICIGCLRINGILRKVMSTHGVPIDVNPQFGTCGAADTDIGTNDARKINGWVVALPIAVVAGHALCTLPLFAAGGLRLGSCDVAGLRAHVWLAAHRGGTIEAAIRLAVCVLKRFVLCASELSTDSCDAKWMWFSGKTA